MLIAQLSQYWAVDPEYNFGWLVPVFCLYLFLIRWRSRPPAKLPNSRAVDWIFCLTGFLLFPTWLIGQSNSDWRVISWLLAIETVALSLCVIYFGGGTSWVRHFAFTICLLLAAVPWPTFVETAAVHGLTQLSTKLTVALLNLFQIPAVQHGNLGQLSNGFVGIDEAW